MAYEAHKWKIGEEITSEKLNHIEKGIEEAGLPREITNPQDGQTLKYDAASGKWVNAEGGGSEPIFVNLTEEGTIGSLDMTWQEIYNEFVAGSNIIVRYAPDNDREENSAVKTVDKQYGTFYVYAGDHALQTASATGYPQENYE